MKDKHWWHSSHSTTCTHRTGKFHACPFAEEISNNYDPQYCDCCAKCTHDCAMEV